MVGGSGLKGIKEIGEEVLAAWAEGAGISLPDKDVRAPWMPAVADLARGIQKGSYTVDDVRDFTREKCKEPWNRSRPNTWSLRAISHDIVAWLQTREKERPKPPPGFTPHRDHLGRTHVWSPEMGRVIVVDPPDQPRPQAPVVRKGTPYRQRAENERVVKRLGREGYMRDFFLMGNSDLSDAEVNRLMELAGDV
jgi:hypothetical protein